jgi:hypothetical protein
MFGQLLEDDYAPPNRSVWLPVIAPLIVVVIVALSLVARRRMR